MSRQCRCMNFRDTPLTDPVMRQIQEDMKAYKSSSRPGTGAFAEFWGLANFWKHYFPYMPSPSHFSRQRVMDFMVELGGGEKSGPVLYDLIIPVFNGAVQIAELFAAQPELSLARPFVPSKLSIHKTLW